MTAEQTATTPDGPAAVSIDAAIETLTFLPDRRPTTTPEEAANTFALLSEYRDGGIFVGHWAGTSEWERHPVGDEIVMVLDGETTIYFLTDDGEPGATLRAGEFVVVPRNTWHRFETPDGVKLLSVTPQPTDHTPRTGPPEPRTRAGAPERRDKVAHWRSHAT